MSLDKKVKEFAHCYNGDDSLDHRERIENRYEFIYGKKYRCGDVLDQQLFEGNGLVTCPFYHYGKCDTSRSVPKKG